MQFLKTHWQALLTLFFALIFALFFYSTFQFFQTFSAWKEFVYTEQSFLLESLKASESQNVALMEELRKKQRANKENLELWKMQKLPFVDVALQHAYLQNVENFYEIYASEHENKELFEAYNRTVILYNQFSS